MGLFGSDEPSRSEELAQEQIELNQAELESKRQNLYKTRLDIVKGQGGQQWTPDRTAGVSSPARRNSLPFGLGRFPNMPGGKKT